MSSEESLGRADRPKPPTHGEATAEFDARAARRQEMLMKTHEFRRKSVRPFDVPEKDYFEYDEGDKRRFEMMGFEQLFKQPVTFRALRWGLFVGGLFGVHRYYRTRDIMNAMHWTSSVSMLAFFNIWYSLLTPEAQLQSSADPPRVRLPQVSLHRSSQRDAPPPLRRLLRPD